MAISFNVALLCTITIIPVTLGKTAQDSWVTLESMPTARCSFGVGVVDGKIFAIGGNNGTYLAVNEMYDPATDMWITKAPMPTPRICFSITVYQNKIYVIGGIVNSSTPFYSGYTGVTEVYDPQTDTWETKKPMPTPRADLEANVVDDNIYLIGGSQYIDVFPFSSGGSNTNEVYNPANDSWTTKNEIPNSVFGFPSAVVGNKIYVMGGWSKLTYKLNQIYDTDADTWSYGKNLTIDTFNAGVGITTGNFAPEKIYIFGTHPQSNIAVNVTQIYDYKNDTWSLGTPMPTARYGLEVAVINDELYAIGGKNQDTYYATNEKYTPAGYIPEIPDWLVVPVFGVLTILAITLYKKMKTG